MTVLQPQGLEKNENQHTSSQDHIAVFWSLLYLDPKSSCNEMMIQNFENALHSCRSHGQHSL